MSLPSKEERIRRKQVMRDAGIKIPNTDESWGPWWDELWKKATTHKKDNDYYGKPSVWNLVRRTFNDITGNDTYQAEPLPVGGTLSLTDNSLGAKLDRAVTKWQREGDPVRDVVLLAMPGSSSKVAKPVAGAIKETLPRLSARAWVPTSRVANTGVRLGPKTATAIDAGLAGSATGASMYDWYLNGPSVENVLGTTLGVIGLAAEAAPAIIEGYNAARSAVRPTTVRMRSKTIPLEEVEIPTPIEYRLNNIKSNRPSKLTEAEKAGIPKGERNQSANSSVQSNYNVLTSDIPVGFLTIGNVGPKALIHKESMLLPSRTEYINNLKEYIATLPKGQSVDQLTINDYRRYLNNMRYGTKNLTDDEIAKLLSNEYSKLVENLTGLLKGTILYHGTPELFDTFDFGKTGQYTSNMGAIGPGNYFSSGRNSYGLLYRGDRVKGNMLPYLITNVSSTPNSSLLRTKGLVPEYVSPPINQSQVNQLSLAIRTAPNPQAKVELQAELDKILHSPEYLKYYKDYILKWLDDWKLDTNAFILDEARAPLLTLETMGRNGKAFGFEGMIHRNTGIKSLFPHPSLLLKDTNGQWVINRNWSDPRVNYKKGGKLNKKLMRKCKNEDIFPLIVSNTYKHKNGGMVRRFLNSGKVEPSFWDRLDNWVDKAEIPMAIGAAGATTLTAATGGLAVPTTILNLGSAGIDVYLALRNLYKGNYAQAGLDGAEMLASLLGSKITTKGLSAGYKASEAATRAAKVSKIPASKRARYIRSHPASMSPAEAKVLGKVLGPIYGALSTIARKQDRHSGYVVQLDNTRVAQRRIHKKGGIIPDPTKGRFTFKRNQIVKDAEQLNGNKDMRKKLVKSDIVTNKKRIIKKGLEGLKFITYTPVETPVYRPEELENPFSEFNFPSTYKDYASTEVESVLDLSNLEVQQTLQTKTPTQPLKSETPKITNHIYKDRNKWVSDLKNAYRKAGITNENALKMLVAQDALESGWGKSALGKFNYGNLTPGKSWRGAVVSGRDKDGRGNPISLKFRSYNSMEEYAADKVQFLKTLYDFNENDNISTFTSKLQGNNKGKHKYAASPSYILAVTKIYNTSKI